MVCDALVDDNLCVCDPELRVKPIFLFGSVQTFVVSLEQKSFFGCA